jgi:ligand-binding sensor domain-containing protein/signal transduction histidine kinase
MNAMRTMRTMRHLCWLLCCLLHCWPGAMAAVPVDDKLPVALREFGFADPYFERDGENESNQIIGVSTVTQDAKGWLWVGTQQGLLRYDGYRWRRFANINHDPHSLTGDHVRSIWAGVDGRLWIGTNSDGLSVMATESERFENFRHDPIQAGSIGAGTVNAIVGDALGAVWVGTDQGLSYLPVGSKTFTHFRHDPENPTSLADDRVRSLLLDRAGRLWVGTSMGLQRLLADGKGFERVASDFAAPDSLAGQEVRTLMEASDGKLWVGTRVNGAAWLDPKQWQLHRLPVDARRADALGHGFITGFVQTRADQIWIATNGGGIVLVAAEDGQVLQHLRHDPSIASTIATNNINTMMLDRAGLLWVGSLGGGLQHLNTRNSAVRLVRYSPARPTGLSHPDIHSILELPNGTLLLGTGGNGIDVFDRKRGLIGGYRAQSDEPGALGDSTVSALARTPDGSIWAGTRQAGVWRLAPGSRNWVAAAGLKDAIIRKLLVSKNGMLWAGTNAGVARWDEHLQRFQVYQDHTGLAMRTRVSALAEDDLGRIWVGSNAGLWLATADDMRLSKIETDPDRADSIASNDIVGLLQDRERRMWVATAKGLWRLRNWSGQRAIFDNMNAMLEQESKNLGGNLQQDVLGRIWTSEYLIDLKQMRAWPITQADGFDIGAVWIGGYTRTRDGLLLVGGTQGLAIFDPKKFQPWNDQPPLAATELKIDGKSFALANLVPELKLRPGQRNFSIEFAAFDFSAAKRNRYRYRLQGYDSNWIETDSGHRNASYGNLWPGRYTLQVQGSNRNGDWSTQELAIPIQVLPAFWQTAWFLALALLAAGALMVSGYRWRVARLRAEALDLKKLIDARTADILKLGEIGQDLTATLDPEQAFERVYRQVSARLDAHAFRIGFYEAAKAEIRFVYEIENGKRLPGNATRMSEQDRPAVWCVRHQRELVVARNCDLLNYVSTILPPTVGAPMETVVYFPLRVQQQIIGCLTVQSPRQNAYTAEQLEFLRVLASYTAIALSNSAAHGELATAHGELATAHDELAAAHQHLQETQAKLILAEKMASLGGLVAGIAHEINTPLGTALLALSGVEQLLKQQREALAAGSLSKSALELSTAESIEYTQLALNTATRAAELVTVFKAIAVRVDDNHCMDVDLSTYLSEISFPLRSRLLQLGCQFELDVAADWHLSTVPDALTEALNRVFANVLDHAFDAERCGTVRLRASAQPDGAVLIEVSDDGYGIEPAHLSKVFDPFFTTKSGMHGHVGLGLHVAYNHVVQRLKGEINIRSEWRQGTTVTIRINPQT